MSYDTDIIDWYAIQRIDEWLDTNVPDVYKETLAQTWARVGKVGEEYGEAIAALIGMTGQNPRKRFTHSQQELLDELADTAFTAILAMMHITKDVNEVKTTLRSKLSMINQRALDNGARL